MRIVKLIQDLIQKSLEFFLNNKNINLIFYFMSILLLLELVYFFEKSDHKWPFILVSSSGGYKVVFVLLEKVITILVGFTPVYIEEPNFQQFFLECVQGNNYKNLERSDFQKSFKDGLKVFFERSNYNNINGGKNNKRNTRI